MSNENLEIKSEVHLINIFMAIWDEELGPNVLDFYPKDKMGDLNSMAIQIFQVYQFFYDTDQNYQRTSFNIPINKLNRRARVHFDIIPNQNVRGGFQPFIVVLIVPDYFTDDQLKWYDQIMLKIAQDFKSSKKIVLEDYYEDIIEVFSINDVDLQDDSELDDLYSYTAAMEDFQAGIKLYKSKNFKDASRTLNKVLKKFELEGHKPLIMEIIFILSSILLQEKKFKRAGQNFDELETLARELDNDKYLEKAIFMKGFCSYKIEDYSNALKNLDKLAEMELKNTNEFQFLTVHGRVLINLKRHEEGLQKLLKALIMTTEMEFSETLKMQQAQLLYEIGLANYSMAIKSINNESHAKNDKYETYFREAIGHFQRSAGILEELNDPSTLTVIYRNIGNILDFLGDNISFLKYYDKALQCSKQAYLIDRQVKITLRIAQKHMKLEQYEKNIDLIKTTLSDLENALFVDQYSKASLHRHLAISLYHIGEGDEAIKELLEARHIVSLFTKPTIEEKIILQLIIDIYREKQEIPKVELYETELNQYLEKLEQLITKKPKIYRPLGELKEIWIFHSIAGVMLYCYTPESDVDNDLLGGFLTALRQFSIEMSQREFESMIVEDERFTIYMEEGMDFYMLGRADVNSNEETLKKIMGIVYTRFWKEFHEQIKNFSGNIGPFRNFTKIIESIDLTLVD